MSTLLRWTPAVLLAFAAILTVGIDTQPAKTIERKSCIVRMQVNRLKEFISGFIVAMRAAQPFRDNLQPVKLFNGAVGMAEITLDQTDIQVSWLAAGGRGIIIAA